MDTTLLTPLNSLETSLTTLLTSLTQTNTYTTAPSATQSLLSADDALSSALTTLRTHQANYTRILTLRAEAERLQTQLRDIMRSAVSLRSEIGTICPGILDSSSSSSSSSSSEESPNNNTNPPTSAVDYTTLLSFAARIGKHNAAAAVEAERQSNRHSRDPPQSTSTSMKEANGTQQPGNDNKNDPEPTGNPTVESLTELASINDTLAAQRAYRGMAFPAAEALRMGLLGKLQYLREQEGEDGVEREVERLVLEGEAFRVLVPEREKDGGKVRVQGREHVQEQVQRPQQRSSLPVPTVAAQLPPKPKKKIALDLDLDFGDSDDDDD